MKHLSLFLFAAMLLCAGEAQAKKSIWNMLFPYNAPPVEGEEQGDPAKTLHAPFAQPETAAQPPAASALTDLYDPTGGEQEVPTDLAAPHRNPQAISEWLVRAVSEILNIGSGQYEAHLAHLKTGMDENALRDYEDFMNRSQTLETLRNRSLRLGSIVDEQPLLLNQGEIEGRYRWLFEMPVTLSFIPDGQASYSDYNPVSQHVIVTIQAARVEEGRGVDGLMIESFKIRQNPAPR